MARPQEAQARLPLRQDDQPRMRHDRR